MMAPGGGLTMQGSVCATIWLSAFVTLVPLRALAQEPDMDESLRHCSHGGSHAEMRECLTAKASESGARLREAEFAILNLLPKLGDQPADTEEARKLFYGAKQAFETYRNESCDFYRSLAMGGNSAGDLTLACVVMLNSERSAQLGWVAEHWKTYAR
jgi:uncharacterized protein YecT (DUF1311 family)